jgi:hypothetical protein
VANGHGPGAVGPPCSPRLAPFIGMLFFFIPGARNRFGLGYVYAWFLMVFFIAAIATSLVLSTGSTHEHP